MTDRTTPGSLHLGGRPLSVVGRARVYVCGVTPYDVTHLGHAATFVWVDAADRVLRRLGVQVEVCRNVTDADDVPQPAHAAAVRQRRGAHGDAPLLPKRALPRDSVPGVEASRFAGAFQYSTRPGTP